jgi:hypothetical protein
MHSPVRAGVDSGMFYPADNNSDSLRAGQVREGRTRKIGEGCKGKNRCGIGIIMTNKVDQKQTVNSLKIAQFPRLATLNWYAPHLQEVRPPGIVRFSPDGIITADPVYDGRHIRRPGQEIRRFVLPCRDGFRSSRYAGNPEND